MLAGCSGNDLPASAASGESAWHQAGYRDALAGEAVRDNDTLTEWYGTSHVDREDYLSGYTAGQADLCRAATLRAWGGKAVISLPVAMVSPTLSNCANNGKRERIALANKSPLPSGGIGSPTKMTVLSRPVLSAVLYGWKTAAPGVHSVSVIMGQVCDSSR